MQKSLAIKLHSLKIIRIQIIYISTSHINCSYHVALNFFLDFHFKRGLALYAEKEV